MSSILRELWRGNIVPNSQKPAEELRRLTALKDRHFDAIYEALSEEQQKRFEAYADCANEYCDLSAEQAFCDGFCLASQMLTEALGKADR